MDFIDRLLGYDHWTTARLLDLSRGVTDAQLDQEFDVGHRTLRATLEHMIYSVAVWTAAMAEQPDPVEGDDRSLAALSDRHERSAAAFAAVARRVRDKQRMDETFLDPWLASATGRTFGGTILHVMLHNTQHRSEALHMLERLGVPDLPDGDLKEWEQETLGS